MVLTTNDCLSLYLNRLICLSYLDDRRPNSLLTFEESYEPSLVGLIVKFSSR